jgi:signal transduction histidine kinase
MQPHGVTPQNIARVQMTGFAVVIALLMTAGFIAIHNVRSIREATSTLVREQATTQNLTNELLRTREVLNNILYGIAAPGDVNGGRQNMLANLAAAERDIQKLARATDHPAETELWKTMDSATGQFGAEVRRLMATPALDPEPTQLLLERHEDLVSAATALIVTAAGRIAAAQRRIEDESSSLLTESVILLVAGLLLAVGGAILTLHVTGGLLERMEAQNQELARVSWQMLENQESTARRFSHELHDEMGQTLAAIKANLAAIGTSGEPNQDRVTDCLHLTETAISNVREMSQLLRPTILDDFGLCAGIRWLADGFMQRTGIETDCECHFGGRLADETETHLFRISQEALTNVARHSGATRVTIQLRVLDGFAILRVEDNGHGFDPSANIGHRHLGLVGMRARARSTGGELEIQTAPGAGFAVIVKVPARAESNEQTEDPHLIG